MSITVECRRVDPAAFEARVRPLLEAGREQLLAALDAIVPPARRTQEQNEELEDAEPEELLALLVGELALRRDEEHAIDLGKWRTPSRLAQFAEDAIFQLDPLPDEDDEDDDGDDEGATDSPGDEASWSRFDDETEVERYQRVSELLEEWGRDGWAVDRGDEPLDGMPRMVVAPRSLVDRLAAEARQLPLCTHWKTHDPYELEDGRPEIDRLLSWVLEVADNSTDTLALMHGWLPRLRRAGEAPPPEPEAAPEPEPEPEPPAAPATRAPAPRPVDLREPTRAELCEECRTCFLYEVDEPGGRRPVPCPGCGRFLPDMLPLLRRAHGLWWGVGGIAALVVGGVLLLVEVLRATTGGSFRPYEHWPWMWPFLAAGVGLLARKALLESRFEPNAGAGSRAGRELLGARVITLEEWRRRV